MQPLAERRRPHNLKEYRGQSHLVGPEGALRKAIESGRIPSMILWGPPGVGKTTLARIIAKQSATAFHQLSAINSGVKDLRDVIQKAERQQFFDQPSPILFVDEIHRFSKSQQDALLKAVEEGVITLIGATTENPSFEVINALLSRCQVYILEPLKAEELKDILDETIKSDDFLSKLDITIKEYEALIRISGGDVRKLHNALELISIQLQDRDKISITNELVEKLIANNLRQYDKKGENHYDIISAFIKSIRGSDPNAAVYWLARMIDGGEDPKFICRRMIISASEDIGLANPNALLLANACFESVQIIGYPEARIIMSQCAVYLANSEKSNSSYAAINEAMAEVKQSGELAVPLHLRNAPTKLMKEIGYGADYKYAHNYESNFTDQDYLPSKIVDKTFYIPQKNRSEIKFYERLQKLWPKKYR